MLIGSRMPDVAVPNVSVAAYALRHAARLRDKPALIDGPSGRTLTYGQLADEHNQLSDAYRVSGIPSVIVIDKNGIIRAIHNGVPSGEPDAAEKLMSSEIETASRFSPRARSSSTLASSSATGFSKSR